MPTKELPNLLNMTALDIYRMLHAVNPYRFNSVFYNVVVSFYPYPWDMMADMAILYRLGRIG